MTSRAGFTGARKGTSARQFSALAALIWKRQPGSLWYHGDAIGADEQAHYVALSRGLVVHLHPCDVEGQRAFCPGAATVAEVRPPLVRNRDIVSMVDGMYACPSGPEHARSGTWSTVRHARGKGMAVVVVWPDGRVEVLR